MGAPDVCWTDVAVSFLSRPGAYPGEAPREVSVIETHLSWVFLTDARAYKLKKAAVHDGLDLRPLEARRRNAAEEVRLNRRLAPDVYLGVAPLARDPAGRLALGAPGEVPDAREVIDWLVVMRRLPAGAFLDRRIREGRADEGEVRAVARRLAGFYAHAERVDRSGPEHRAFLARGLAGDRRELSRPEFGVDRARVERVTEALRARLEADAALFDRRAADGRLVEGHGDLRPEHIHLGPEPVVIDCLEFDRALRLVDPADELAYLALECDRLGAPRVGRWVLDEYRRAAHDPLPPELLAFYRGYRACRRATLAAWHLLDPRADAAKWRGRAAEYLALAL
ncbi:MAG: hypothetical protein M9894_15070 [Planctomycetes bacterium]|nr:hypothetical protein [Planctomycetota bacterium]